MRILILNGPNLNLLGKREPDIYGNSNFQEFYEELSAVYDDVATFDYLQSNVEGELINILQASTRRAMVLTHRVDGVRISSLAILRSVS